MWEIRFTGGIVLCFANINMFQYKTMKGKSNLICAFLDYALFSTAFCLSLQAEV